MIPSWSEQSLWKSAVGYACMFFEEGESWRGQGQKERVGHLAQLISFFPTCLPFQCWSLKVLIRGKTSNFLPFRNYPEMSILLSVMFPSKTTSECKPQEPKDINVIAAENHWLNRSCFKAQNWLCFKILACFSVFPSIYSFTEKWYAAKLSQTKRCKRISAPFPLHLLGLKHPLNSPWATHNSILRQHLPGSLCPLLPSVTRGCGPPHRRR